MISGSGGNILVLPGKSGKLMVDSGFATSRRQVSEALASLSTDPIRMLVNTHWHFDHTDGNEWVHSAGAAIVAQAKTLQRMRREQTIPEFEGVYPPSPAGALPTVTFDRNKRIDHNGKQIVLTRYTPAHTDTDIAVQVVDADVLHTGDTWFNGFYPFIDYNSGGSIDGMIAAAEENLNLATRSTIVVPGHGATGSREDLTEFHRMLVDVRASVSKLKRAGTPVDDVISQKPTFFLRQQVGRRIYLAGAVHLARISWRLARSLKISKARSGTQRFTSVLTRLLCAYARSPSGLSVMHRGTFPSVEGGPA